MGEARPGEPEPFDESGYSDEPDRSDEPGGSDERGGRTRHAFRRRGTRRSVAVAAAAVAAVVVAAVVAVGVFGGSGGGSGQGSAAAKQTPPFNPQALYPLADAGTAYTTGGPSSLTDAALQAAVPGCGSCRLVTRANGFSPAGAVLALFRTGEPAKGHPNAKLAVVGADGKLLWQSPSGFQALTAGIERFAIDRSGYYYVALPGLKSGQAMVILAWRDGRVADVGDLARPLVSSDTVGLLPEKDPGATATIVAQSTKGVPDADTGGLIETQYQVRNGAPALVGCRREVGESFEWITFAPSADGCTHWPAGPAGPADGDEGD